MARVVRRLLAAVIVSAGLAAPAAAASITGILSLPVGLSSGSVQINIGGFWSYDAGIRVDTTTHRLLTPGIRFPDGSEQTSAPSSAITEIAHLYIGDLSKATTTFAGPLVLLHNYSTTAGALRVICAQTSFAPPAESRFEFWRAVTEFASTTYAKSGSLGFNLVSPIGVGVYNSSDQLMTFLGADGKIYAGGGNALSGFSDPYSTLDVVGGIGLKVSSSTTDVDLRNGSSNFDRNFWLLRMDATDGDLTVYLPNLNTHFSGKIDRPYYRVCKVDSSTNTVGFIVDTTPGGAGADAGDGLADLEIENECVDIYGQVTNTGTGDGVWREVGRTQRTYLSGALYDVDQNGIVDEADTYNGFVDASQLTGLLSQLSPSFMFLYGNLTATGTVSAANINLGGIGAQLGDPLIRFYNHANTNYVEFQGPTEDDPPAAIYRMRLPNSAGSEGQVLGIEEDDGEVLHLAWMDAGTSFGSSITLNGITYYWPNVLPSSDALLVVSPSGVISTSAVILDGARLGSTQTFTGTPTFKYGFDLGGIHVSSTAPTINYVLAYNGSEWVPAAATGSGEASPELNTSRLTLQSGEPNPTADQTGKTIIYLSSGCMAMRVGGAWVKYTYGERSSTPSLTSGKLYDCYASTTSSTDLAIGFGSAWANDTSPTDVLTVIDGVLLLASDTTKRYLGTVYATGTNTMEDSASTRAVCNLYNPRDLPLSRQETANSWTYNSATLRPFNNSTSNRVLVVVNRSTTTAVHLQTNGHVDCTSAVIPIVSIDIDGTNANDANSWGGIAQTGIFNRWGPIHGELVAKPGPGLHFFQMVESVEGGGTCTFYGDDNGTREQAGINGMAGGM